MIVPRRIAAAILVLLLPVAWGLHAANDSFALKVCFMLILCLTPFFYAMAAVLVLGSDRIAKMLRLK